MGDIILALTNAGQALRTKIEAGNGNIPLSITRIVTASGKSGDPISLIDVVDEKQEFTILSKKTTGARTVITAHISNMGNPETKEPPLSEGYELSQIGFYALDPDYGEILYRISQFDMPYYVPAATERGWNSEPTFCIVTGNASKVVVTIDTTAGSTSKQDVWDAVELSDAEVPDVGVRVHYRIAADAPNYKPYTPAPVPAVFMVEGVGEVSGVAMLDDGSVFDMAVIK